MRNVLLNALVIGLSSHAGVSATIEFPFSPPEDILPAHDGLFKRQQGGCRDGYNSCANINAPNVCCSTNAQCSLDSVGHAACCPIGAACTGTIAGSVFATGGGGASTSGSSSLPSTTASFSAGLTTSNGGVIVVGATGGSDGTQMATATAAAPYVPNQYYPFRAIPTTYQNAAACTAAYNGCQSDLQRCTSYLQGGQASGGVTISAPNFTPLQPASTTLAPDQANSVCSSLSMQACSGLQSTACQVYGNGGGNAAPTIGCAGVYQAGIAAAGVVGQMLLN